MRNQLGAAERMMKGINQGTSARKMLKESRKFSQQLKKRVKL